MYVTFSNLTGSSQTYQIDFSKVVRIHTAYCVDVLSVGAGTYAVLNPSNQSMSGQPKDIKVSPSMVFPSGYSMNLALKVGNPALYMNEICPRFSSVLLPNGVSLTLGFEYL